MPPKAAPKPRPITWKVVGGAMSGGLIVRRGPETKSSEYNEKLTTGSVIQELEVQGERMKYKRVMGTGPDEGWISTQFKGKDLLQRRPLKVWILCAGTRGDLQPYLALALGLQEAGYKVAIWSCEDYRSFVESYGVKFFDICKSCEMFIKRVSGISDSKKDKEAGKQVSMETAISPEEEEEVEKHVRGRADLARMSLSLTYNCPVGEVNSGEGRFPPAMEEMLPNDQLVELAHAYAAGLSVGGNEETAERWRKEAQRREELRAEWAAKEWADWAETEASGKASAEASAETSAEAESHAEPQAEPAPASPPATRWMMWCTACMKDAPEEAVTRCLNCEAYLCPACDDENHSTELLKEHVRSYFVEVEGEICFGCGKEPSVVHCLNCLAYLCAACDAVNHGTALLRRHVRRPLEERGSHTAAKEAEAAPQEALPTEAARVPEFEPQSTEPAQVAVPEEAFDMGNPKYEAACLAAAAADPWNEEAQHALESYRDVRQNIMKLDISNGELLAFGMEGFFLGFHVCDDAKTSLIHEQLERNPPDLLLYNTFWSLIAFAVEWKYSVPAIYLALQPSGMVMSDPKAPWMSPEVFSAVKAANSELLVYPDLETARQYHEMKEHISYTHWVLNLAMESVLIEPHYGVTPVADMGHVSFYRRHTEKHLVGFLSSVASNRFLKFMGDFCAQQVAKHFYTGFWIMDEKHQTSNKTDMFGGEALREKVEDFIAAGDAPAYIGWGSCICQKGRHWMIALAVCALHKAGMRGIILAGWAELNTALLEDLLGSKDETGMLEYARKNILFIEKAPQIWLFPLCSVLVIHGGVGTLAAAWTSGTPLIVLPVWLDQFPNAWLNMLMGAGIRTNSVDECTPDELAYALRVAVEDPQYKRGAQAVQFSMLMDKGIQAATEYLDNFLLEEVPSGRWKHLFLDSHNQPQDVPQ